MVALSDDSLVIDPDRGVLHSVTRCWFMNTNIDMQSRSLGFPPEAQDELTLPQGIRQSNTLLW